MKRKNFVLLSVIALSLGTLVGCKGRTLSNDVIEINKYKNLEVDILEDLSNDATADKYEEAVWNALLEQCEVENYPEEELATLTEELRKQYSYVAYYDDKTADELIEELHGMSAKELAKKQLMKKYAVQLIAEKEELTLAEEEYADVLAERAKSSSVSAQEYENMFGAEELQQIFLEERVMEFLKENIK